VEAILLIGVQGAGKTTFCTQRLLDSHVRISQDLLKTLTRVREQVMASLAAQQPFVVDNTNTLRGQRAELIAAAKAASYRVIGYYFPCERRDAIRRNLQRAEGRVPPAGVAATHKRLEIPALSEGFDELFVVTTQDGDFRVQPWPMDAPVEPTKSTGEESMKSLIETGKEPSDAAGKV
jgi:predicted kinase